MRIALCLVMLLTATATADDGDHTEKVRWRAPKGCPDARGLRQRVEKRLERSLDDVSVGVDVDVEKRAGRYTATIDLRAVTVANDVRHLTSRRCGELADAVAVIVARVASDALAHQDAARPPGDVIVVTPDAADAPTVADALPAARKTTAFAEEPTVPELRQQVDSLSDGRYVPKRWAIGGRLSTVSAIGVLPRIGTGAELALTIRRQDHFAELAGTRWIESSAQIYTGRPAKLDVGLDVAAVRFGWRPRNMPLRAWLGVESGSMRGTGVSLPTPQFSSERWLAAGAGFGIAWQMRPWIRLFGANETMLAIERARFSNGQGMVLYAPNPMSFRTIVGLELGWQ
ncbi:MAG TPA: hypothetical protein VMZ53_05365 [Kofleriaceae bacterium]|nr:hypothetical protein [Kofleriaceae bacterium]